MGSIFSELRRRNVFRVAGVYAVVGWLLMQLSTQLEGSLNLPTWFDTFVTVLVLIGFPMALVLAWAFELTPEGVKPTTSVSPEDSLRDKTAKRLDIAIIAGLVLVAGLMIGTRFMPAPTQAPITQVMPWDEDKSIAVLPFTAFSSDDDDSYFGKGIAEEVLNALAQFPELKVAARTSAFSFDGENVDIREIGEKLGVAHVLEGSIRRSGDRIRITAQLIRADDGFHLWSQNYERELTDIFEIQDEIVAELSRVLQFQLGVGVGEGRAPNRDVDPRAYDQYMRGLDLWWQRDNEQKRMDAILAFRNAIKLDEEFADAWAAYAVSLIFSGAAQIPGITPENFKSELQKSLDRALELDPDNTKAHAGSLTYYSIKEIDIPRAQTHLQDLQKLAPNSALTQYSAANFYAQIGDMDKALEANGRAIALDPLNKILNRTRFELLAIMGRFDEGLPNLQFFSNCSPDPCPFNAFLGGHTRSVAAHISSPKEELQRSFDEWKTARKAVEPLPPIPTLFSDFLFNYFQSILGEDAPKDYWNTIDRSGWLFDQNATHIASILAQNNQDAFALGHLNRAYETGTLFNSLQSIFFLTKGGWEIPDRLRRDPRYHDFWSLPGMAGLAAARRANGATAGLPLPTE